jgi:hypothetical protein
MNFYDRVDNKWTWLLLVSLIIITIVLTVLTVEKSRFVTVSGTTWEWANAPPGETGFVQAWETPTVEAETWMPPPGMELKRLEHAYITYYAVCRNSSEKVFTISSAKGTFSKKTSGWKMTNDIIINLFAEKEGYITVNATFLNKSTYLLESNTNFVHIIMVAAE